MKLHEHAPQSLQRILKYGEGQILVGEQRLTAPCILCPSALITQWITQLAELNEAALEPALALKPQVLLLGSSAGSTAGLGLRQKLADRGIALEAMDLGAACRTYNVLAQEDRAVVALLFP
jgi:uncharacterized protein